MVTCSIASHQQQEGVCDQLVTSDVAGLQLQTQRQTNSKICCRASAVDTVPRRQTNSKVEWVITFKFRCQ
jgi:hypothetical protein